MFVAWISSDFAACFLDASVPSYKAGRGTPLSPQLNCASEAQEAEPKRSKGTKSVYPRCFRLCMESFER